MRSFMCVSEYWLYIYMCVCVDCCCRKHKPMPTRMVCSFLRPPPKQQPMWMMCFMRSVCHFVSIWWCLVVSMHYHLNCCDLVMLIVSAKETLYMMIMLIVSIYYNPAKRLPRMQPAPNPSGTVLMDRPAAERRTGSSCCSWNRNK